MDRTGSRSLPLPPLRAPASCRGALRSRGRAAARSGRLAPVRVRRLHHFPQRRRTPLLPRRTRQKLYLADQTVSEPGREPERGPMEINVDQQDKVAIAEIPVEEL